MSQHRIASSPTKRAPGTLLVKVYETPQYHRLQSQLRRRRRPKNKKTIQASGNKIIIIIPYPYPYHILLYSWGQTAPLPCEHCVSERSYCGPFFVPLSYSEKPEVVPQLPLTDRRRIFGWLVRILAFPLVMMLDRLAFSSLSLSACIFACVFAWGRSLKLPRNDNYKVLKLICVEICILPWILCLLLVVVPQPAVAGTATRSSQEMYVKISDFPGKWGLGRMKEGWDTKAHVRSGIWHMSWILHSSLIRLE